MTEHSLVDTNGRRHVFPTFIIIILQKLLSWYGHVMRRGDPHNKKHTKYEGDPEEVLR